jgi:hypothetical protein
VAHARKELALCLVGRIGHGPGGFEFGHRVAQITRALFDQIHRVVASS